MHIGMVYVLLLSTNKYVPHQKVELFIPVWLACGI